MRRSAWVPLPTPGAPTRMMRAALLIFLIVIANGGDQVREGERRADTSSLERREARSFEMVVLKIHGGYV